MCIRDRRYAGPSVFGHGETAYTAALWSGGDREEKEFLIHFPLYMGVKEVWVGVDADASVAAPAPRAVSGAAEMCIRDRRTGDGEKAGRAAGQRAHIHRGGVGHGVSEQRGKDVPAVRLSHGAAGNADRMAGTVDFGRRARIGQAHAL